MNSNVAYRADIDGLRAIAVVPVVLFHLGIEIFSGGYVGVDVFFVISGYLITSILLRERAGGGISMLKFYERRARRLLPALFLVLTVTSAVGAVTLLPVALKDFGQSLVGVSLFSSNLLFWLEADYFAPAAEAKPLLHTWSLAVEEQFYLVFPLLLVGIRRLTARMQVCILVVFALASLWSAVSTLQIAKSMAFYFFHTRAWELLLGVLVAYFHFYASDEVKARIDRHEWISTFGLFLILTSILTFDETFDFPGFHALIPTLGAAAVILCQSRRGVVHSLLSTRALVGIGLISYSLYLWHQPLIALSHSVLTTSWATQVGIFIITFVFAYISWRFVERPFRSSQNFSRATIFSISSIGILIFISLGSALHVSNGAEELKLKYQFSEDQRNNYALIKKSTGYDMRTKMVEGDCLFWVENVSELKMRALENCEEMFGKPIFLIGDSHAMNVYNALAASDHVQFIISISRPGCRPYQVGVGCPFVDLMAFFEGRAKPFTLVYHQSGAHLVKTEVQQALVEPDLTAIESVAEYLIKAGKRADAILWLGHFPEYGVDPAQNIDGFPALDEAQFAKYELLNKSIESVLQRYTEIQYVRFDALFSTPLEPVSDACLIWMNADHWSSCGELVISHSLDEEQFDAVFDRHLYP